VRAIHQGLGGVALLIGFPQNTVYDSKKDYDPVPILLLPFHRSSFS
jgi:hypothetical protein